MDIRRLDKESLPALKNPGSDLNSDVNQKSIFTRNASQT